jgi:predicted NAD-dependent protein-ADP-ribosyltransferase YbiA (DUF1768 family)
LLTRQKRIGASIGNKDWDDSEMQQTTMTTLAHEKIKQNEYRATVLLATGNRVLAEENPYDMFWGIDTNSKDVIANNWKGKNIMGKF